MSFTRPQNPSNASNPSNPSNPSTLPGLVRSRHSDTAAFSLAAPVYVIQVRPWEARFGPELDWEKPWRDQVFGARMTETNGSKLVFF